MKERITSGAHSLRCPFCEVYELEPSGQDSARCPSCGAFLGGALLETLAQITGLPLAIGRHACECGHPEMRLLPDGVYRCPACASEVTPIPRSSRRRKK
jgi:ribosomal protein L37AE/L43A